MLPQHHQKLETPISAPPQGAAPPHSPSSHPGVARAHALSGGDVPHHPGEGKELSSHEEELVSALIPHQATVVRPLHPESGALSTYQYQPPSVADVSRYLADYRQEECLGSGGFGSVFRVYHQLSDKDFAVKKIILRSGHPEELEMQLREVRTFAKIEPHPNVVRYYNAWLEPANPIINQARAADAKTSTVQLFPLSASSSDESDEWDEPFTPNSEPVTPQANSQFGAFDEVSDGGIVFGDDSRASSHAQSPTGSHRGPGTLVKMGRLKKKLDAAAAAAAAEEEKKAVAAAAKAAEEAAKKAEAALPQALAEQEKLGEIIKSTASSIEKIQAAALSRLAAADSAPVAAASAAPTSAEAQAASAAAAADLRSFREEAVAGVKKALSNL
mmetsp:Transcript_47897/g.114865  ORF Transcript_47897/g.114865 Transcript_47897/m.114865 type:complete len:387 (+) Transcript_47897:111-1271(+)